jgi:divalent metal cation (Fe/Co/Zn/Cd) transporter
VQTHLEPLAEEAEGHRVAGADVARDVAEVNRIVVEQTGAAPRELRFVETPEGRVVHLTLGVDGSVPLEEAHRRASQIEEQVRDSLGGIAEIIVHTEP